MRSEASPLGARRVAPERAEQVPPAPYRLDSPGRLGAALDRRPVTTALFVLIAVFVVAGAFMSQVVGRPLGAALLPDQEDGVADLVGDVLPAAAVAWLLAHLGWFARAGFSGPSQWRSLRLFIFPALLPVLGVLDSLDKADLSDTARAVVELPGPLLTGFWEEGLVRGFLLFVLLAAALRSGRGPIAAVLGSSVVFGLMHAINAIYGDPAQVASQVIYATLIGICFAALLLRTNALWMLVALHFLFDVDSALVPDGGGGGGFGVVGVLLTLPLALYGLWLLRKREADDAAVDVAPDPTPASAPARP